jgi:superfamily I DNA/RNA helicase
VEEGSIPHQKSIEEGEEKIEEERRLFYVGVTRAMRSLCLSFAAVRRRYGDELEAIPSRFIEEIPPELLEFVDAAENEPLSAAQLDAGFGALQAEWEKRLQEP